MKKLILSSAAIMMALAVNSFAGTPEKGEAKTPVENKTTASVFTYRVIQEHEDGTVEFEEGPGQGCAGQENLCEWQSSTAMPSPQQKSTIETSPNVIPGSLKYRNIN